MARSEHVLIGGTASIGDVLAIVQSLPDARGAATRVSDGWRVEFDGAEALILSDAGYEDDAGEALSQYPLEVMVSGYRDEPWPIVAARQESLARVVFDAISGSSAWPLLLMSGVRSVLARRPALADANT